MNSPRKSTLKNGNRIEPREGRQEGNKLKKAIDLIGEERLRSLIEMHLDTAFNHEDEKLKASAQAFLIDRFVPKKANIPHQTYLKISLLPIDSIQNLKKNVDTILKNMGDGCISMEEGKELFSMIEQARKTYETNEMAIKMFEIDQRMKEKGL